MTLTPYLSMLVLPLAVQPPTLPTNFPPILIAQQTAEEWVSRGVALFRQSRHQEALSAFDRAIQINPNNGAAWKNRAITLLYLRRNQEAVSAFDRAIAINPKDAVTWNGRGESLDNLGRYEEAILSFDRAIQINPNYTNALNGKGLTLSNLGRYDEAISVINKSLQINANNASTLSGLSYVLGKLGRHTEALEFIDRALKIDNKYARFHYRRGFILDDLERYDEALIAYQNALRQLEPNAEWESFIWHVRGITLLKIGNHEEALLSFDQAIQTNRYVYYGPRPGDADLAESYYGKALALFWLSRYPEVVEALDRALAERPNFPNAIKLRDSARRESR